MKEVIVAHLTCEICNDTWFRDMDAMELDAYLKENPDAPVTTITESDGTMTKYIDLDGVICDGCEDFYNDEYALDLAEDEEVGMQYLDEFKEDA